MAMRNSVAREYLQVADKIRNGSFHGQKELQDLTRQKATLHKQLNELCGHTVSMAEARQVARRWR
jgi:hypothetical protein